MTNNTLKTRACNKGGGEEITYRVDGFGSERKLIVSYSGDNDDWRVYFKDAGFEKKGDRDIDVLFSLGAVRMPGVRMPVRGELEVPLPLELYILPKGYKLKKRRLNVYTQVEGEERKRKCSKELDHAYVPVKMSWLDKIADYVGLSERF